MLKLRFYSFILFLKKVKGNNFFEEVNKVCTVYAQKGT